MMRNAKNVVTVCGLIASAGLCGCMDNWSTRQSGTAPIAPAKSTTTSASPTTNTTSTNTPAKTDATELTTAELAANAAGAAASQEPATANVMRVSFAEEGSDFDPAVSPDGTRVVYASTQHRPAADLYLKRADSRVVTQLTNDPAEDATPSVSPDGQKVAFGSNRAGNWDIYVMPVSGGKAVQITSESSDEIAPSWSPDGSKLVFSRLSPTSGRWEMWVCEVANPANAQFIGHGLLPKWCPVAAAGESGSERILYQLGRERGRRTFSLWTIDLADGVATNSTEIVSSAESALINPAWSPDGKWIAFAEVGAAEATNVASHARPDAATLWMISVDGEERVRLTSGGGVALSPVWGKNNRLFFVSDRSGRENIWSLDVAPAMTAAASLTPAAAPVANVQEGADR